MFKKFCDKAGNLFQKTKDVVSGVSSKASALAFSVTGFSLLLANDVFASANSEKAVEILTGAKADVEAVQAAVLILVGMIVVFGLIIASMKRR